MSALAREWGFHLLHAAGQDTLAGLVVLAVVLALGHRAPRLRHALLVVGLLKFALPPMLPLPTGVFSAAPPVAEQVGVRSLFLAAARRDGVLELLLAVHLTGTGVLLVRLAAQLAALRTLRRQATPMASGPLLERLRAIGGGDVPLLLSGAASVPMALGVRRPAIVLPRSMATALRPEELDDVLRHELHHVRRGDVLANLLQSLLVAAWWFHPLVHVLDRLARSAREERCDDAVLAAGRTPRDYAGSLLAVARLVGRRAPAVAAAVAERPSALVGRVRRLAKVTPDASLERWVTALAVLAALLLLPGLRVSADNVVAFDHATRRALGLHGR